MCTYIHTIVYFQVKLKLLTSRDHGDGAWLLAFKQTIESTLQVEKDVHIRNI